MEENGVTALEYTHARRNKKESGGDDRGQRGQEEGCCKRERLVQYGENVVDLERAEDPAEDVKNKGLRESKRIALIERCDVPIRFLDLRSPSLKKRDLEANEQVKEPLETCFGVVREKRFRYRLH